MLSMEFQKCHLTIIAFHFMYGVGRLQRRTACVFYQFQIFDNIAEKGGAGGLKILCAHLFSTDSGKKQGKKQRFTTGRQDSYQFHLCPYGLETNHLF